MTSAEKSLLLYLETCAVDQGGRLDQRRINDQDLKIMAEWQGDGFVETGRVASESITRSQGSFWVTLSDEAWKLAHRFREERAERMWHNRRWMTTDEKREGSLNG